MTVSLIPMTQNDFAQYTSSAIKEYADEKVKAGTWTIDEALTKSSREYQRLLPDGMDSHHQYLYVIADSEGRKIGWLWYKFDERHPQKEAFIFDFKIFEEKQGLGYAKAALRALDDLAVKRGIKKISLHVFSHNKRAIYLYEKLDYKATDINMSKWLE
ncbi:GNAT family acetyltransferase [Scopulibacillus darangshiensis]|uniref:GNAT family acetyltransferase n=1 Tax=Scopulibacillus darangshiensis TaxID=442528 RepID=A0A4R2NX62_9BACL|nr:GNAT family N-acetyltransferase [Scopulibacillus darangshiensis]TCP26617.1 GNAT family acetyltransferase [Scopulibacillus darangshiensis]